MFNMSDLIIIEINWI